jgi:signal transduction histidine kinase
MSLASALPRGATLPVAEWETRHRGMVALLWIHVPIFPLLALGYGAALWHALLEGAVVAVFGAACVLFRGSRRARSLLVTFSLLSCSAILTHIMKGAIEAHFHFFVMVTVLALYEDWVPFLASIGYVLLHHGLGSAFAHDSIFNHSGNPWLWAGVHAFFIAGLSAANVVNWRAAESMRDDMREATNDLRRSNRELEDFAYIASHDLTEPLRMITSYLQLLDRRAELDDEAREYLEYACDGAGRMRDLIDDLLRYSRAGRVEVQRERIPAAEVVEATMRDLAAAIEGAQATVEVAELPTVDADPVLLAQVFQNLLANAVKFHDGDAPKVRVSGREIAQGWEFTVEDNGIGVDPSDGEKIFKMFQRLHHRDEFEGTGIGLSVCQRIVERHGGEIRVEPVAGGHGSRFVFTLASDPTGTPA